MKVKTLEKEARKLIYNKSKKAIMNTIEDNLQDKEIKVNNSTKSIQYTSKKRTSLKIY